MFMHIIVDQGNDPAIDVSHKRSVVISSVKNVDTVDSYIVLIVSYALFTFFPG